MRNGLSSLELRELTENRERALKRNAKTMARARRKVDGQRKAANLRAKYGPSLKPAPVTLHRVDGGNPGSSLARR